MHGAVLHGTRGFVSLDLLINIYIYIYVCIYMVGQRHCIRFIHAFYVLRTTSVCSTSIDTHGFPVEDLLLEGSRRGNPVPNSKMVSVDVMSTSA